MGRISEVLLHLKTINIEAHFESNKVTAEYMNSTEMAVQDQSTSHRSLISNQREAD